MVYHIFLSIWMFAFGVWGNIQDIQCYICYNMPGRPGHMNGCGESVPPREYLLNTSSLPQCSRLPRQIDLHVLTASMNLSSGHDIPRVKGDAICIKQTFRIENTEEIILRTCGRTRTNGDMNNVCNVVADQLIPGIGVISSVKECYCNNRDGCNDGVSSSRVNMRVDSPNSFAMYLMTTILLLQLH